MFYSGQKVVCVDAGEPDVPLPEGEIWADWDPSEEIVEGEVYTVFRQWVDKFGDDVVSLVEVERCPQVCAEWGADALGYCVRRFRPVVDRSASIEVFKRLLVPSVLPTKERA